MTTVVGIESTKRGHKHGVVLASDLTGTRMEWKPVGDTAYREQRKIETQKIYVDNKNGFAFCMSGIVDSQWEAFCSDLRMGKIPLEKRLKECFFPELKSLNEYRWEGTVPNNELMNNMLIASRIGGKLGLYTCFPLGKVEPRRWTSIGSGSKYALEYIQRSSDSIPHFLSLYNTLDLAVGSLDSASQDLYTGGLDLVVVTKNGIHSFGNLIEDNLRESKRKSLKDMKSKLHSK